MMTSDEGLSNSQDEASLEDKYASFSKNAYKYGTLFERLKNREFLDLCRPWLKQHIMELKAGEETFAKLHADAERLLATVPENTDNWIKAKKNRDYTATAVYEVREIRQQLEKLIK